jgi:hypothetical protein
MSFLVSDTNGSDDKVLVNIKTSTIKTVDFKHKKTPFKKGEVALTVSLQNITIVDKNNLKCPGSKSYLFVLERLTATYNYSGYSI